MKEIRNPWAERFTWFWFCEDEIKNLTEEDFDRRARELYERGITVAINFTLTHFRMGFYGYWDQINEAFRKFVVACHKYGIKVVEHHSASLVHNMKWWKGWKRFEDDLGSFSNWTATVDDWIEVPRFLINSGEVGGKKLSDMYQIDGRTGKVANTVYDCNVFCFNNPDYQEMYMNYMKKQLSVVPFDGVMNDDIQYFGDGHACTCKHCRKLFSEEFGYELPQPEAWGKFYGDYSNPVFVAWERFTRKSAERWNRALTKLYKDLGFNMMRPNYISACMYHNKTRCGFDVCCDEWTHIFQENCFSAVLKQSYPDFMVEAVHRFAAAERNGVPSMSMFYPDRPDSVYFGWALAKTWGQMYTGTSEGVDISEMETKYRVFEGEHFDYLSEIKKREDIAFYFSMQTRDYLANADKRFMEPAGGAIQAAEFAGYKANLAFESDSVEQLLTHPHLACVNVALTSDEELSRFNEYARRGGKLILMGNFGEYDATSAPRNISDTARALGMSAKVSKYEQSGDVSLGDKTISGMDALVAFEGGEAIATMNGKAVGIREKIGDGEIIWYAARPAENELQETVWAERRQVVPERVAAHPSRLPYQAAHTGAFLKSVLDAPRMQVTCEDAELLTGAYDVKGGIALHVINIKNTVSPDDSICGHEDIIESFADGAAALPAMSIKVKCDDTFTSATLWTPEKSEGIKLAFSEKDGAVFIDVPANAFAGYALIELQK